MSEHTPGPWKTIEANWALDPETGQMAQEAIVTVVAGEEGKVTVPICEVAGAEEYGEPSPTVVANARLIAAAPRLLAALEWALGYGEFEFRPNDGDDIDAYQKAKAAIAKARGQS
jgi:hypothetical protein